MGKEQMEYANAPFAKTNILPLYLRQADDFFLNQQEADKNHKLYSPKHMVAL